MRVPLVDLKAQYETLAAEVQAAIARVIETAAFIRGPEVEAFEREFAAWCGAPACAGTASGTDALYLALRALGIGRGDAVLTTPHTFIATAEAISLCGAAIRFVDTLPESMNIDPDQVRDAVDSRTRAILPVHLNGHPAKMEDLLSIARKHNLAVVEDAAQAHGARVNGKPVGTLGDAGCFSFFPGKNLGAYGDAGAVISGDPAIAHKVRMLSNHGRSDKYLHEIEGLNARMDGLQAAILRAKLPYLNGWIEARRAKARVYQELLSGIEALELPAEEPGCESAWHLYVIRLDRRDECLAFLRERGIEAGIHYPAPLHLQPAYSRLGYRKGDFPVSEANALRILSLPLYPEIREEQQAFVAESIREFAEKFG
ncbi:MAG: DegT/DnrJ/EryC1/StrS family aminotransferase [Candidatus Omnitrophica bacterium]|nr:dTDP-3-amino-3,4,6-trideoxy-alpha-D-glucose transaminase [bacterium]NUN96764.1 DegT/DnrJ/EryC1/StrS family aminotransferase [Candidatus Omnitrophota bacterium]